MNPKWALITGATQGLGASLVRRFWESGYSLALCGRNRAGLENVANSLGARKDQSASIFVEDFSDPGAPERLFSAVSKLHQRVDVLINNAAVQGPIGPVWDNDWSDWTAALQIDLVAPVALCRAFVPLMTENGGGSIINLSGGGATGPRANFSAYATAKAGLVRFSETLADEVRALGIRVNCIAPGAMQTAMLAEVISTGVDAAGEREFGLANKVFAEGGASMDRVADLALFLASDQSKGITGRLISAVWDRWEDWTEHLEELSKSDAYTLRRIAGRDRGFNWGDK